MSAQQTFTELRKFWRDAYESANFTRIQRADLARTCREWVGRILDSDHDGHQGRKLLCDEDKATSHSPFTVRLPEPFFGRWCDDEGKLRLQGKSVVVLINPGSEIKPAEYAETRLSRVGRPLHDMFKDFYVRGAVEHNGTDHALIYKRTLAPSETTSVGRRRRFAWGWWRVQFPNMMRSLGIPVDADEEEHFVTLELFAYSSPDAKHLDAAVAKRLRSSRLVIDLVRQLALEAGPNAPRRIVLVNKRAIWREVLDAEELGTRMRVSGSSGFSFARSQSKDSRGTPRAYHLLWQGRECPVQVRALSGRSMYFPQAEAARKIFDEDRA